MSDDWEYEDAEGAPSSYGDSTRTAPGDDEWEYETVEEPRGATEMASESLGLGDEPSVGALGYSSTDRLIGTIEDAVTMGTGALATITGGFWQTTRMMMGRSNERANQGLDAWVDALTYQPRTKEGQQNLEMMAAPMMKLDQAVSDIAHEKADGNPYAATAIKTAILGTAELIAPSKVITSTVKASRHVVASAKKMAATADSLGIDPTIRNLKEDVVNAANEMTPELKGEGAPLVQEALREANEAARIFKDEQYEKAREAPVYVDTRSINDLATETRVKLDESFDTGADVMPKLNKRLNELGTEFEPGTKIKFWELEKIRRKIVNDIKSTKVNNPSESLALRRLKKDIDGFIDNEFNKTAIEAGQVGPPNKQNITGEIDGVQAWKDARETNRIWKENFSEDKVIRDLIREDATAETMADWLIGATKMGARKEAASTIARIKTVLGDNHPAIESIRQELLFKVSEPLLSETPNFGAFIKRYNELIKNNPSIVKELGLKDSQFAELVTFAKEVQKLPVNKRNFEWGDLTRGLAVFWQGHNMAKRSLRVGYARTILNGLFQVDRIGQKQILADMAGIRYGYPLFPKKGPAAGAFIAGASMNELMRHQEEEMDLK